MKSCRLDLNFNDFEHEQLDWNAGLWLDRYLPSQSTQSTDAGKSSSALTQHFADVANITRKEPVLNLYRAFFTRWVNTLKEIPEICLLEATVLGRMVVGLGAESVLENSIALQRTYGLPYIPGSGLKGWHRASPINASVKAYLKMALNQSGPKAANFIANYLAQLS